MLKRCGGGFNVLLILIVSKLDNDVSFIIMFSTVRASIGTIEPRGTILYCDGCSILLRDTISIVDYNQCCGGKPHALLVLLPQY